MESMKIVGIVHVGVDSDSPPPRDEAHERAEDYARYKGLKFHYGISPEAARCQRIEHADDIPTLHLSMCGLDLPTWCYTYWLVG